jgi:HTH-type transcriptional regulator / antitoxin HigA
VRVIGSKVANYRGQHPAGILESSRAIRRGIAVADLGERGEGSGLVEADRYQRGVPQRGHIAQRSTQRPSKGTFVMDIRPTRSEVDYRVALTEIERLWDAEPGTPEGDHAEILSILIEAYEAKHDPIPAPDPIAAIVFMMEQNGLTCRDLEAAIGSRGRVSEILGRKRPLTLPMVRALRALLNIPVDVLLQPYDVQSAA